MESRSSVALGHYPIISALVSNRSVATVDGRVNKAGRRGRGVRNDVPAELAPRIYRRKFELQQQDERRGGAEAVARRWLSTFTFPSMFARHSLRAVSRPAPTASSALQRFAYATAATSHPAHFSAQAVEDANPHGMEISKAQRIAENGFVSGSPTLICPSGIESRTRTPSID